MPKATYEVTVSVPEQDADLLELVPQIITNRFLGTAVSVLGIAAVEQSFAYAEETDPNADCGHCITPEDRCSDLSDRNCMSREEGIDRQQEEHYRSHSSSITGIFEGS